MPKVKARVSAIQGKAPYPTTMTPTATSRDADRDPLREPQPLPQHDDAQDDRHDRVHEVAEARLDHVAGQGGDDVDLPVDVDQAACHGGPQQQARLTHDAASLPHPRMTVSRIAQNASESTMRQATISNGPVGASSRK